MTGSIVLDVVIGLLFVYLLYSLFATILLEIIARWIALRPRVLLKSIARMLEDSENGIAQHSTVIAFFYEMGYDIWHYIRPFSKRKLTQTFYEHPAIKYLGENSWNKRPSAIEPATFVNTLTDILRGNNYSGTENQVVLIAKNLDKVEGLGEDTKKYIQKMLLESNNDIDRFKARLDAWYNEAMNRTIGWYKRKTQLLLFIIGLGIAFLFNVDTLDIYNRLAKDKKARESMVQLAEAKYKQYDPQKLANDTSDEDLKKVKAQLEDDMKQAGDILGTGYVLPPMKLVQVCRCGVSDSPQYVFAYTSSVKPFSHMNELCQNSEDINDTMPHAGVQLKYATLIARDKWKENLLIGWIITAIAISLGAPFWYDLLNRFMQLRSSVKAPTTSTVTTTTTIDGQATPEVDPAKIKG